MSNIRANIRVHTGGIWKDLFYCIAQNEDKNKWKAKVSSPGFSFCTVIAQSEVERENDKLEKLEVLLQKKKKL